MDDIVIRRAKPADLPAVARLAADLVRQHHAFDPPRFMLVEPIEDGYRWWLGKELRRRAAIVLVAVQQGEILGYAYGTLEPRDWNDLLDACGKLNDLYVAPAARRRGIARRLTEAMLGEMKEKGAPRVVLMSAAVNRGAQEFFAALGFRSTMVEMTRESDPT